MVHQDHRVTEERLDQREKKEELAVMVLLVLLDKLVKQGRPDFLGYQVDLVHRD